MQKIEQRRAPKQARSQQRVEDILAATLRLVGSRGNDAVSMRAIAAEAGVPVSSVYQYFPDKNALLRALIVRYMDVIRGYLVETIMGVTTIEQLVEAAGGLLDRLLQMFIDEPSLASLWNAVTANTVLREYDMADTREIAEQLAAFTRTLAPDADESEVFDAALYLAHVVFYVMRIAYHADADERQRLMREQKKLIALRLGAL